jgi:hypothetical protein
MACGAGAGLAAVYAVPPGGALFTAGIMLGAVIVPVVSPGSGVPGHRYRRYAWPGSLPGACALAGAAALPGAAMQVPLTGVVLVMELICGGFPVMIPMITAVVTASVTAGASTATPSAPPGCAAAQSTWAARRTGRQSPSVLGGYQPGTRQLSSPLRACSPRRTAFRLIGSVAGTTRLAQPDDHGPGASSAVIGPGRPVHEMPVTGDGMTHAGVVRPDASGPP